MKNFIKNTLLILVSLAVCLVAAELIFQQTSIGSYSLNRGYLFSTDPSFIGVPVKAVKYQPNTAIREIAIFGEHVEYDVTNQTNNLGYFDNVDYIKADQATESGVSGVVFLGDSFTAGSGGTTPWISTLRELEQRPDLALYNLGVSGTGIKHFYQLLKNFGQDLPFDQVNIMAITNDFFRPLWYPIANQDGVRFCPEDLAKEACLKHHKPKMLPISLDDKIGDVVATAREQYQLLNLDADSNRVFHQRLRLFNLYCHVSYRISPSKVTLAKTCPQQRIYRLMRFDKDIVFAESINLLKTMQAEFPQVQFRLFHLPQKGEVYAGKYALDIEKEISATGMQYIPLVESCDWELSLYHKHDGHPNDKGYFNLAKCMSKYLPQKAI